MTDNEKLAALIETWLLGIPADSQDLELEDHDWQLIIAALRTPQAGDELAGAIRSLLSKWERRREVLNMQPDLRQQFCQEQARILSRLTTLTPADTAQSEAEQVREAAANWHDEQATFFDAKDPRRVAHAAMLAKSHREAAAAIRAMPLPKTGDEA